MAIMGSPDWAYYQVWEDIHDAIELLIDAKTQLPELEEPNLIVNETLYIRLVEASMKAQKASQIVSAMTKENNEEK